jgi:hypothetical protein
MAEKHPREALIQLFSSKLIIELQDMKTALEGVSAMTVFRYLKQISYRRSYNHNGRYYTLYKPSKFDRCGIWNRGDILFSIDGSLLNTVRRFVHESDAGATHRELQDILKTRVHNALAELTRKGQLERERLTAVFVYLHSDPTVKEKQLQRRRERIASKRAVVLDSDEDLLSDAIVIQVLLTLIRHPGSNPGQVVRRLRGHSPPIKLQQVSSVFTRYNLGEKGGCTIC